ncbi:hypothetical protein XENTR_v10006295 [Xenopus tropicalis]|nr:hypothetical protein XENTR_v10006295 [Xenopus tropicalis]
MHRACHQLHSQERPITRQLPAALVPTRKGLTGQVVMSSGSCLSSPSSSLGSGAPWAGSLHSHIHILTPYTNEILTHKQYTYTHPPIIILY